MDEKKGFCADCNFLRPLHPWNGHGELICEPCDEIRRDQYERLYGDGRHEIPGPEVV